jgi:hypothetical protein
MPKGKRSGAPKDKTRVPVNRDQTRLPDWLDHPLTRHQPMYNPTIKVGTLRWALIWGTARYPKTSFGLFLAFPLLLWGAFFAFTLAQPGDALIPFAVAELPLLVLLLVVVWPVLLYRLSGLPRPALRQPGRSQTQILARCYSGFSGAPVVLLIGNGAVLWLWSINFTTGGDFDTLDPGLAFAVFIGVPGLLLFGYPLFRAFRVFFRKPRREMSRQKSDLHPDAQGRTSRRRKAAAQPPPDFVPMALDQPDLLPGGEDTAYGR